MSGQPTIQGREKMRASKRKVTKEDLKLNLVGDRERAKGGDPGTETLVQDNVTNASRNLRRKAGGTTRRGGKLKYVSVERRAESGERRAERGERRAESGDWRADNLDFVG
jgi:hypothetical protein